MRPLVAGCAGFIGYHLCKRLLDEGARVIGIDNFASGRRENAADLRANPAFQFIEADISESVDLDDSIDVVYNLACPASPIDFGSRRLDILRVCSAGVWNLLDLCRKCGATLVHSSTSEVYGDPLEHPQRESYWGHVNPIGPRACYDEGKRFAEALITNYRKQFDVETRVARIFNTYGPRMRASDGRALPNFITQALTGQPLTVYGDGSQTRSFCFVSDLVDGLTRLARSDFHEPVNLGNPVEISIKQVAEEVIERIGGKSEIVHIEAMRDDPKVRRPDISRARKELAWEPLVPRDEGLEKTIEWFRQTAP